LRDEIRHLGFILPAAATLTNDSYVWGFPLLMSAFAVPRVPLRSASKDCKVFFFEEKLFTL